MEPLQLSLFDLSPATEGLDIDVRAEELADWVIQEMEKEGLDRAAQQQFLMHLQVRTLMDSYVRRIPERQRWQFIVRLINAVIALESN